MNVYERGTKGSSGTSHVNGLHPTWTDWNRGMAWGGASISTGSYLHLHFENLSEELCTPQVRTVDTFWPPQLSSTKSPSHQQGTHTIHAITSLLLDGPHLQVAAHGNSNANGEFDLHVMIGPHWKCKLNNLKKKILQNLVGRCSKMLMFGSGSNSTQRRRPTSVTMICACLCDYCFLWCRQSSLQIVRKKRISILGISFQQDCSPSKNKSQHFREESIPTYRWSSLVASESPVGARI